MSKLLAFGLLALAAACSSPDEKSRAGSTKESEQKCDAHTDLTQGTIDGPECDETRDIWGRFDTPNLDICEDYTFKSTAATEGERCSADNQVGFCVDHDPRYPENVTLLHRYEDPDSTLDECDELHLKSYQCLNNPLNTWCNVKFR